MVSSSIAFVPFVLALTFALVVLAAPFVLAYLIIRMLLQRRDAQMLSRDEQAQLRRLMESMQRMEDRIGNLETILITDSSQSPTPQR
jgi:phage shock protein B